MIVDRFVRGFRGSGAASVRVVCRRCVPEGVPTVASGSRQSSRIQADRPLTRELNKRPVAPCGGTDALYLIPSCSLSVPSTRPASSRPLCALHQCVGALAAVAAGRRPRSHLAAPVEPVSPGRSRGGCGYPSAGRAQGVDTTLGWVLRKPRTTTGSASRRRFRRRRGTRRSRSPPPFPTPREPRLRTTLLRWRDRSPADPRPTGSRRVPAH